MTEHCDPGFKYLQFWVEGVISPPQVLAVCRNLNEEDKNNVAVQQYHIYTFIVQCDPVIYTISLCCEIKHSSTAIICCYHNQVWYPKGCLSALCGQP